MENNGKPEPQVQVFTGKPGPRIGLPALFGQPEQWKDGLLFVMRLNPSGDTAWIEEHGGKVVAKNRISTAEIEGE